MDNKIVYISYVKFSYQKNKKLINLRIFERTLTQCYFQPQLFGI